MGNKPWWWICSGAGAYRHCRLVMYGVATAGFIWGMTGVGLARAAPPQVVDTMAQRLLACTSCHGEQGRASAEGYVPRIAGKPAGYLHQQLLAFRDGRRRHDGMARLLEHLGDDYLVEMAAHFAALNLPYVPASTSRPAARPDQTQRGRQLALEGDSALRLPACVDCHGSALTGVAPWVPGLVGLPKDYVLGQLGGWRVGARQARKPDCMAQIAKRMAPADVAAVAEWLQAQPVPVQSAPALQPPGRWPMDCGGLR